MQTLQTRPFSNRQLVTLLIPLLIEQFLSMTVGLADSMMVSYLGEVPVSAVSLVDTVNVLLVYLFSSLASGGAIVTGQYLGRKAMEAAQRSAEQLMIFVVGLSVLITAMMYALRYVVIHLLFGAVEPAVAAQAVVYFNIVEISIPFLAIYSVGAALFRVMGDSKTSMKISLVMNLINVSGNALLIFVAKWGVAGVAVPTLLSRIYAAAAMVWLLRNPSLPIRLSAHFRLFWDRQTVRQIVRTAVPNGVEGSFFQLGKILLLSVVSRFGTVSIAANSIANTVCIFHNMPGSAVGMAMVTVISQCAGNHDFENVRYYHRKLMWVAYGSMTVFNLLLFVLTPGILGLYGVSDQTRELAYQITMMHGAMCIFFWSAAFVLPNTLRACGDTRFVMIVSVVSMWVFRLVAGYLLATVGGYGVLGIWMAMFLDWFFRISCFVVRWRSGKWKTKVV